MEGTSNGKPAPNNSVDDDEPLVGPGPALNVPALSALSNSSRPSSRPFPPKHGLVVLKVLEVYCHFVDPRGFDIKDAEWLGLQHKEELQLKGVNELWEGAVAKSEKKNQLQQRREGKGKLRHSCSRESLEKIVDIGIYKTSAPLGEGAMPHTQKSLYYDITVSIMFRLEGYESLDQALMDNINAYCSLLGMVNTEKLIISWIRRAHKLTIESVVLTIEPTDSELLCELISLNLDLATILYLPILGNPPHFHLLSQRSSPLFAAGSLRQLRQPCSPPFVVHNGFVEDQFGLGLIARAAEEGIAVIKPTGIMVFNIGGRPGQGVCKRLFERRGFQITKLWQTKVIQAADTDISSLVEIENDSPHRFEFFMGLVGNQPICARTAWAYGLAGGCISHSLSVYSCQLRQPHQVKKIFDFLKSGYHEVSNSLDLSFDDDSVADEKIPFLAYLSSVLKEISSFPYDPPAGNMHFRKLITRFMKIYHHIPLSVDSPTDYANGEDTISVIEAPRQSDLMIQLIDKLKPQVVVTGMAHFEAITSSAFENLLQTTRDIDCRLFLDLSEHLELSSMPGSNGVLKYLSENTLPPHAAIFCGLVKNKDNHVSEALSKVVELLEGHTALISQYYYGCLFHELLAFQIADRHPPSQRKVKDTKPAKLIGFTSSAISSLNAAELSIVEPKHHPFVHMDVDQSFLPIPSVVKSSVFEIFARQNMAESEIDVCSGIRQLIKDSHGFSIDNSCEIICGNSSQSLFSKLVLCCIREEGTFLFPSGTNGCYVTTAKFLKANTLLIPTQLSTGCKLVPKQLASLLGTVRTPWVYISGPTISPTGLLYSNNEIHELLSVCANFGARVVIDTTFSGLEFRTEDWTRWDLQSCLSELPCLSSSFSLCLLGGLSFELLTGGLDFGYLILTEPLLTETFYSFPSLNKPHSTIRYAMKRLLALKEQKAKQFLEAISEHKQILKNRSQRLNELLSSCGWDVIPSCGGISMVAKPSAYLGKMVKMDNETKIEGSNIREAVLRTTGLCINSGCWTGIPDFCRFNIALEPNEFERALVCLTHFNNLVLKA
ncbi:hypothetical protein HPP92_001844 [Vanilla planifolia]|uniref:Aminotransferase class I/classII large domain-containing protein n=1 Tax=Vanilla planifolia TaxID=51239 RepID=A0A835VK19_VANPL|nr:hypothetical protein HPP92_001844 [Vanilla planifolia]